MFGFTIFKVIFKTLQGKFSKKTYPENSHE